MITTGDYILVVGADGKDLICKVENIRGEEYDVFILKLKMRHSLHHRDIIMEAYEFYNVSHITDRHPTLLDLKSCEIIIETAPRLARMRTSNPIFRVRLKSGMDTKEEADKLRILFDPQDAYEEKILGLPDLGDVQLKIHEAPIKFVIDAAAAVTKAQDIITRPCSTFDCPTRPLDGLCDTIGCSNRKHIFDEQFTDEDSTTHLEAGAFGQEQDYPIMVEEDDRLDMISEEDAFEEAEVVE